MAAYSDTTKLNLTQFSLHSRDLLLIVPYGIETKFSKNEIQLVNLLIVPYGIETSFRLSSLLPLTGLLIVPYGIETQLLVAVRIATTTF